MKILNTLFALWIFFASLYSVSSAGLPEAQITVRVVGENDEPISNAVVLISFEQQADGMKGIYKNADFRGLSDSNGEYSGSAAGDGYVFYMAEKEGYYKSQQKHQFLNQEVKGGKWNPWNPVLKLMLLQKVNPVPMYMKHLETNVPEIDKPIGFDLQIGDWVNPFGKGEIGDIIFEVHRNIIDQGHFECALRFSFSNKGDGILPYLPEANDSIEFSPPRIAAENGYQNELVLRRGRVLRQDEKNKLQVFNDAERYAGYILRIRSVLNEKGEVVKAWYGKVGGFEFDPRDSPGAFLRFTYFLNPDGTRNLEFDPARNLSTNLGEFEDVRDP
jgi:hypothetical protein